MVELAAARGLSALALTDHDTVEGIAEAQQRASDLSIELVPGVELSLQWEPGAMHMVVLFLDPASPLALRLGGLQLGRDERNQEIVARLAQLGIRLAYEEVLEEAGGGSVGRPHIAAVLVRHGHVPDIPAAFDLFLAKGRPAYVDRRRLQPAEAIRLARDGGGVPVLAHPHTLGLDSSQAVAATLADLVGAGLIGMECYYPLYSPLEREGYAALARRFGLVPSGGSDYHGTYKIGIEIGVGRGDLVVSEALLEELRPV